MTILVFSVTFINKRSHKHYITALFLTLQLLCTAKYIQLKRISQRNKTNVLRVMSIENHMNYIPTIHEVHIDISMTKMILANI